MAIQGFGDKMTELFFRCGQIPKKAGWKEVASAAARKLDMLEYAAELGDLKAPPGNRLESLKGNFKGHHSIRVNARWRVVFRWTPKGPDEVRIIDYHV